MDFVLLMRMMTCCVSTFLFVCVKTAVFDSYDYEYPTGSIPCKLFDVTQLDCSQRCLRAIPTLPINITSVDLSQNSIMTISKSVFRGQLLLTIVDLQENNLLSIHNSPFKWLVQLKALDLSNTFLETLAAHAFHGLHTLEYLNLNSNRLTSLPDGIFECFKNLLILELWIIIS